MAKPASNSAWRHYWRENRLAACVPDNPDSAAAIEAHWTAFFESLPDGSRVLDIATGNGVLLVWASRAARSVGRELELSGIDSAEIDPQRFLTEHQKDLDAVRFIGTTAAESLPFANGSFDAVVSQYGLEYADLESALGEASRVLVPGGQLHWLAHAANSVVVKQGRRQLADIELLLAVNGPFSAMDRYLEARVRKRRVERSTRELTEALRTAEAHCAANPSATLVRQLCGGILDTANRFEHYRPEAIERWSSENQKRLRGQRQRIRDLQAASLTEKRLAQVEQTLDEALWTDISMSSLTVGDNDDSVGRLVHAARRRNQPS